jgi:cytoskeletal protein RodZ
VTLQAWCLRHFGRAGSGGSPRARLLVALVAAGLLWVGDGGQALAQGPGPEPAPGGTHRAPSPEPAPVVGKVVSRTPKRSSPTSQGSSSASSSVDRTRTRLATPKSWTPPAPLQTSSAPTSRPPSRRAPAKQEPKKARQASSIARTSTRQAVRALPQPGSRKSNLLLLGGLALLVLVLGDTMFLALSARFLRQTGE